MHDIEPDLPIRGRPPERIRVTISKRVARGEDPQTEDLIWPKNWPIPESGDIALGKVLAGWVEHVEYDLSGERIIIVLRP